MSKVLNLLAVVVLSITIFSCTKGGSSSTTNGLTLKYEITTSSPIISRIGISYLNGTDQWESDTTFYTGSKWSKDVVITSTTRPFDCVFMAPGIGNSSNSITLASAGTVNCNIYINGDLKAHSTYNTTLSSGKNVVLSTTTSYIITP